MTFDVAAARAEMPSVCGCAYFNAGMFGPLPRAADVAMRAHMDASFERGRTRLDDWFGLQEDARRGFARAMFADEATIALTHCATDGINTVMSGLPFEEGDEVVTTTQEHPGITAPLDELARRQRMRVRVVEPTARAIAQATTPRTRLIAVSHVLWTTGEVLPIATISAAARARGALVLVDGAQALGAIDVDPQALGCDFYAASGQKWLCGPSGTGALWVRPAALGRLRTPWPWYLSKQRDPSGVRDWTTARRLDTPTVAMTSLAGVIASLAWHRTQVETGALTWAETLATMLRDRLATTPRVHVVPVETASTLVSFTVDGEDGRQLAQRLEAAKVYVRSVPGGYLRASVGFWNDESDVEALLRAL